jgi:hypothetical protein
MWVAEVAGVTGKGRRVFADSLLTASTPLRTTAGTDIDSIAFMPRSTPCGFQTPGRWVGVVAEAV